MSKYEMEVDIGYWPIVFMSWVERLGRTLRETVGVGEDGDGGVDSQEAASKSMKN